MLGGVSARVGFFRAGHSPYWLFPRVPFFSPPSFRPPLLTLFTLTCRHGRNEERRCPGIMEQPLAGARSTRNYDSASLMPILAVLPSSDSVPVFGMARALRERIMGDSALYNGRG